MHELWICDFGLNTQWYRLVSASSIMFTGLWVSEWVSVRVCVWSFVCVCERSFYCYSDYAIVRVFTDFNLRSFCCVSFFRSLALSSISFCFDEQRCVDVLCTVCFSSIFSPHSVLAHYYFCCCCYLKVDTAACDTGNAPLGDGGAWRELSIFHSDCIIEWLK